MKRTLIIALLALLCSVCSYGQQSYFDKYAEMEGVTSVYITKSMLSLFPKGQTNVNGINIGNIASRLDNIQILSSDENPSSPSFARKPPASIPETDTRN